MLTSHIAKLIHANTMHYQGSVTIIFMEENDARWNDEVRHNVQAVIHEYMYAPDVTVVCEKRYIIEHPYVQHTIAIVSGKGDRMVYRMRQFDGENIALGNFLDAIKQEVERFETTVFCDYE